MNTPIDNTYAHWRDLPATPPLLRPSEVLKQTGLSRSTMFEMISRGEFPNFIKIGRRASAMPASWLESFIAAKGRETRAVSETDGGGHD